MTTRNLYFIDSAVTDYQSLLSQLPADSEWYLLDKSRDGIGQIAELGFKRKTPAYGECVLDLDRRLPAIRIAGGFS